MNAPLRVMPVLVMVIGLTVGCDDDGGSGASETSPPTTATETLQVLVTNDDGVDAPGLDVLVNALVELPDVEVTVVAPATEQSVSSDATTPAPTHEPSQTASGVEATAVDGEPADAVLLALDELGVEPDVVIAGANSVQNLGLGIELSGTVGAARTAARAGVPAVAVSQGRADEPDYEVSVGFAVEWLVEHRAELLDGSAPAVVVAFNAPTCPIGEVRGLVEVPVDVAGVSGGILDTPDCTSTLVDPVDDVQAFLNGYATRTIVAD